MIMFTYYCLLIALHLFFKNLRLNVMMFVSHLTRENDVR